jgi:hypothetical protein
MKVYPKAQSIGTQTRPATLSRNEEIVVKKSGVLGSECQLVLQQWRTDTLRHFEGRFNHYHPQQEQQDFCTKRHTRRITIMRQASQHHHRHGKWVQQTRPVGISCWLYDRNQGSPSQRGIFTPQIWVFGSGTDTASQAETTSCWSAGGSSG